MFMQIPSWRSDAAAQITGDGVSGRVRFWQLRRGVLVEAKIAGLPREGFFAFHIHEGPDCGGAGFSDSGGHYHPAGTLHPDHAGDLPPLLSYGGRAWMAVMTNRFRVRDIVGRTVIIHSGTDDFQTQPSGNPGEKLACGVIRA